MLKKIKENLSKPVTWGGYLKLCIICAVISIVEFIVMMEYYFGWVSAKAEQVKGFWTNRKLTKNHSENEVSDWTGED